MTSTTIQHRVPAEGADYLTLAGVNDANLQELARLSGCRVILRGDHLVLSGEPPESTHENAHSAAGARGSRVRVGVLVPALDEERALIFELFENRATPQKLCQANFVLGEAFARAALAVIDDRVAARHGRPDDHRGQPAAGPRVPESAA